MRNVDALKSRIAKWYWLSIPVSVFFLFGLLYVQFGPLKWKWGLEKEGAFRKFFAAAPAGSIQLLEYGYARSAYGDGSYALTFSIQEQELHTLLAEHGFTEVRIESDANRWSFENSNWTLTQIMKSGVQVFPDYKCYEKKTKLNTARVFYDKNRSLAIYLGYGRYPK